MLNQFTNKRENYIADYYGLCNQLDKFQEECAEAIQAVSKFKNGATIDNLVEELADVEIMVEQIKYLTNVQERVEKIKDFKLNRQISRINAEKEQKMMCEREKNRTRSCATLEQY